MDFLDLGAFEEMMGNSKHKQGSVRERERVQKVGKKISKELRNLLEFRRFEKNESYAECFNRNLFCLDVAGIETYCLLSND